MEREEMEDGVVLCLSALVCLSACPRRRSLCIWFQCLGFADAIVASPLHIQKGALDHRASGWKQNSFFPTTLS
jgi:hypothetical protein